MSGPNPFSWNAGSVLSMVLAAASLALAAEPRFPTKPAAPLPAKHATQVRARGVSTAAKKDDAALGTASGQLSETCVHCHSLYPRTPEK